MRLILKDGTCKYLVYNILRIRYVIIFFFQILMSHIRFDANVYPLSYFTVIFCL